MPTICLIWGIYANFAKKTKKMFDSSQLIFSLTLIAMEPLDQIMDTLTDIMVTMEAVRI